MFFKFRKFEKFRKFHRKTPVGSFLNKIAGLRACNFIKKILQHKCFPVKFAKFFKNTFLYRTPLVAASELLERLRLGFSHLHEHKSRHCFQDTVLYIHFVSVTMILKQQYTSFSTTLP